MKLLKYSETLGTTPKYQVVYKLTRKVSSSTCLADRDVAGFRQPGIIVLVPGSGKTADQGKNSGELPLVLSFPHSFPSSFLSEFCIKLLDLFTGPEEAKQLKLKSVISIWLFENWMAKATEERKESELASWSTDELPLLSHLSYFDNPRFVGCQLLWFLSQAPAWQFLHPLDPSASYRAVTTHQIC